MPRRRSLVTRHLTQNLVTQKHQRAAAALTKRSATLANRAKVRQGAALRTQAAALAKMAVAAGPAARNRARAQARFRVR